MLTFALSGNEARQYAKLALLPNMSTALDELEESKVGKQLGLGGLFLRGLVADALESDNHDFARE